MVLTISEPFLTIVAILAFAIIIGLSISLHELGHLVAAKKAGVLCYDYSVGFGPIIYKKQKGETQYSIRAIPLGGFVQMAGMIDLSSDIKKQPEIGLNFDEEGKITEVVLDPEREAQARGKVYELDLLGDKGEPMYITLEDTNGNVTQYFVSDNASYVFEKNQRLGLPPYERTVDSKSKPWRLIVFFAGAFMNFVLALIIYFIVSFATGVANNSSNEIGSITDNFPAGEVLQAGDKITSVNGVAVSSWDAFSSEMEQVYKNHKTSAIIKVSRNNEEFEYEIYSRTAFNSFGLSDFGAETKGLAEIPTHAGVYGLEVGNVNPVYKNKSDSDNKNNISKGDYLVGISIGGTEYSLNEAAYDVNGKSVSGYGYLAYLVEEHIGIGDPAIKFEYYHLDNKNTDDKSDDEYTLVSFDNAKEIEPYTDELLDSQNVTKIVHLIGVASTTHFDFFPCVGNAFKMFWTDFTVIFRTLKLLIAPSDVRQVGVSNLSGVVGIFGQIKSYVNTGFIPLLAFAALLSVNLGIVNLLPIPALDGGKILFVIIEAITKKKVPKKVEAIINGVFMLLLLGLMIFVTVNDIMRI